MKRSDAVSSVLMVGCATGRTGSPSPYAIHGRWICSRCSAHGCGAWILKVMYLRLLTTTRLPSGIRWALDPQLSAAAARLNLRWVWFVDWRCPAKSVLIDVPPLFSWLPGTVGSRQLTAQPWHSDQLAAPAGTRICHENRALASIFCSFAAFAVANCP